MKTTINLFILFVLSSISFVARVSRGKIDSQTAEAAGLVFISLICLYIEAVKFFTMTAFACYNAGKTVRRWWDGWQDGCSETTSTAPIAATFEELLLLDGFSPKGLLMPSSSDNSTLDLPCRSALDLPCRQAYNAVLSEHSASGRLRFTYTVLSLPAPTSRQNTATATSVDVSLKELLLLTGFTPRGLLLPHPNYGEMKLSELKQLAKKRGLKGYSKLRKNELIALLSSSMKQA